MAKIGGQLGQTKESRAKNIKEIKDWFNKAIDTIGTRSNGQLARNGGIMGYGRG